MLCLGKVDVKWIQSLIKSELNYWEYLNTKPFDVEEDLIVKFQEAGKMTLLLTVDGVELTGTASSLERAGYHLIDSMTAHFMGRCPVEEVVLS